MIPAGIAVVTVAFMFWRWLGEPVTPPDVPGNRLQCLSYTPFEPGDASARTPGWVSTQRIERDLAILGRYTGCLRVYTPLGNTPRVVAAAVERGFRILLGVWIGSDREQNRKEIAAALQLAQRHPQAIEAIVLGNEVLLRRELTPAELASLIGEVRQRSPVPIAYADVAHFIETSPAVANAADLLLIHLLPYWDDPQPPDAVAAVEQVIRQYEKFVAKFPDKPVMIGETGWPSKGRQRGPGKPSLVNEARFVRTFAARAAELGIRYNLIEAIDQPWKRPPEGTVGGYWGVLDQHREPKFALSGPVSGWPQWREYFLAAAALALLGCAAGMRRVRGFAGWSAWAVVSLALGLALVFQWDFVAATRLSAFGWAGGGIAALGTILAAAALRARLAGKEPLQVATLGELGRARYAPLAFVRTPALLIAACMAIVMTAAAWHALTLAFAPRHRDFPLAQFMLPACAIAMILLPGARDNDSREETLLAATLLACGALQLEWRNPQSWAWLAICALLAAPWIGNLKAALSSLRQPTR